MSRSHARIPRSSRRGWDLQLWLRALVAAALVFGSVEIAAGIWFGHAWSTASGIALVVFGALIAWSRRHYGLEDGTTVALVIVGLLLLSFALSLVLPLGRAPLAIVPVMASLLATAYGGPRAAVLVGACWVGAMSLAIVPLIGARETVVPESFRAGLLVATQGFIGSMSILLAFRLYGSLRRAVAAATEREQEARAFFAHALDAIITMDVAGRILTWNPRAEAMFGWSAEEAIGRRLSSTIIPADQRAAHEAGLRRAIGSGTGPVFNARTRVDAMHRDGHAFPVELAVIPLELGGRAVYGGFVRDLTAERAADERLDRERRHRAEVAAALASIRAQPTLEATAAAICRAAMEHTEMSMAGLYRFLPSGDGVALAVEGPPGMPIAVGAVLDRSRAAYLRERAALGPWVEEWRATDEADPYRLRWRDVGLVGSVHVPLASGPSVIGILSLGTAAPVGTEELTRHLATAVEFGALASALIARDLESRSDIEASRAVLAQVIAERAFDVVFQPVVALASRIAIGYEALTRFRDGTRPDVRFAEAHRHGLGLELESVTLAMAVRAATRLPAGRWLALNISPEMILDRRAVERVVSRADRPVVLELAESMAVADYGAIQRAVAAIRPEVRLAVDDAGAGYAGLRHLVELRPAFVKLDLHLVRNLDQDAARQALIAGMAHFADSTGCELIAEGIETPAELDAVLALGIGLGQGYLLARPATATHQLSVPVAPIRRAS